MTEPTAVEELGESRREEGGGGGKAYDVHDVCSCMEARITEILRVLPVQENLAQARGGRPQACPTA